MCVCVSDFSAMGPTFSFFSLQSFLGHFNSQIFSGLCQFMFCRALHQAPEFQGHFEMELALQYNWRSENCPLRGLVSVHSRDTRPTFLLLHSPFHFWSIVIMYYLLFIQHHWDAWRCTQDGSPAPKSLQSGI